MKRRGDRAVRASTVFRTVENCLLVVIASSLYTQAIAKSVHSVCTETLEHPLLVVDADLNCSTFSSDLRPFCCGSLAAVVTKHPSCSPAPWRNNACQGGFFDFGSRGPYPCPNGALCPDDVLCFIGCPEGSYCEQTVTIYNSVEWRPWPVENVSALENATSETDLSYNEAAASIRANTTCSPSDRKLLYYVDGSTGEAVVRCGGQFQSTALHDLSCSAGHFCPNTTAQLKCPDGAFCREGSTEPRSCPFLATCSAGSSTPKPSAATSVVILSILLLEAILLFVLSHKQLVKRALAKIRAFWKPKPKFNVVQQLVAEQVQWFLFEEWEASLKVTSDETNHSNINWKSCFSVSLEFQDVSLSLNKDKQIVLSRTSGFLLPGTATAIIGESGSGKSSLLNALAGRAHYGKTTGTIHLNGEVSSLSNYRDIVGFVPQDDIMHRDLTAREVLYYQALLRLPKSLSKEECKDKVQEVIDLLGLNGVADTIVGDAVERGISGGQKKRVNVGIELIAEPRILFLDEPTSGLDSVSAVKMCQLLHEVAHTRNITVAAVVHQLQAKGFYEFDYIMILQRGGYVVFHGTHDEAKAYYARLGYAVPLDTNPADFYLQKLEEHNTTAIKRAHFLESSGVAVHLRTMGELWHLNRTKTCQTPSTTAGQDIIENHHIQEAELAEISLHLLPSSQDNAPYVKRETRGFFQQLRIFCDRGVTQLGRQIHRTFINLIAIVLVGTLFGALFQEVTANGMVQLNFMTSLAIGLTGSLSGLVPFGESSPIFWRESSAGICRPSYFLAIIFLQAPVAIVSSIAFLSFHYLLIAPRGLFIEYFRLTLLSYTTAYGLGYCFSLIFPRQSAQLATAGIILLMSLLSGSEPSLCDLDNYGLMVTIAYNLSFCRWLVEGLFEINARRFPGITRYSIKVLSKEQGFSLDNEKLVLGVLATMTIGYHILAFVLLILTKRGQQNRVPLVDVMRRCLQRLRRAAT